jgi:hypothetical protein
MNSYGEAQNSYHGLFFPENSPEERKSSYNERYVINKNATSATHFCLGQTIHVPGAMQTRAFFFNFFETGADIARYPTVMLADGTRLRVPIAFPVMRDRKIVGVDTLPCCGEGCLDTTFVRASAEARVRVI